MRSILTGAAWLTAANLAMRAVSMLFQVYTSRVLGAAGVGLLQLILTVGGLAMTLGTAGARVAATCLVAQEYGLDRPAGIRQGVRWCLCYGGVLSMLAAGMLYLLAPRLASGWIGSAAAAGPLRLFALTLPVNCLWGVLAGYFTASGQVRRLVGIQCLDRLLTVAVTLPVLLYWAGDDLQRACLTIVGGNGAATVVSFAALALLYRRTCPKTADPPPPMARRLLRLAGPLAFNEIARAGLNTLENLLIPAGLKRSTGSYEAALADYGAIQGMTFPVLLFPSLVLGSLSDLMIPELARARARGNWKRIRSLTRRCLTIGLVWAVCVGTTLFFAGDALGNALYHSSAAGHYLRLFAPVVLILYMDAITDGLLKGLVEQVACMRYNTVTSILDVALIWLLLPGYGIGGFFFAFVVTHALNFLLSMGRLIRVVWGPQ